MSNMKRLVLTGVLGLGFGLFGVACQNTEKTENAASAEQSATDHTNGEHPNGEHPNGEHPNGEHPNSEHPEHPG